MAERKGGFGGFKLLLLLIVIGMAVWFLRKGWLEAVCPGEEEVMSRFVATAKVPAEDDWTSEDIAAYWAEDEGESPHVVGAWQFRARGVFLRFGSLPMGMDTDERIVLSYPGLEGMESERLIVCAKPVTLFARLRLFVYELGSDMSVPEPGSREKLGVWIAPDR